MPVYNNSKELPVSIESVLQQNYHNWELLVINDGSTDTSLDILKQYANKTPRIKITSQENHGVSHARNRGLQQASGAFICFLDADDTLRPDFLRTLFFALVESKADMARCQISLWGKRYKFPLGVLSPKQLITRNYSFLSACGTLYTAKLLSHLKFEEKINYGEDHLFFLHALCRSHKIISIPYIGYNYHNNPSSAIHKPFSYNKYKTSQYVRHLLKKLPTNNSLLYTAIKQYEILYTIDSLLQISDACNDYKRFFKYYDTVLKNIFFAHWKIHLGIKHHMFILFYSINAHFTLYLYQLIKKYKSNL